MNIAAVLLYTAVFLYYIVALALLLAHIFRDRGDAELQSSAAAATTVLLFAALPAAVLGYAAWEFRYGSESTYWNPLRRAKHTSVLEWRLGVFIKMAAVGITLALLIDLVLRHTNGFLILLGLPLLSRISGLTALLVPATLLFPLSAVVIYMLAGGSAFSHSDTDEKG